MEMKLQTTGIKYENLVGKGLELFCESAVNKDENVVGRYLPGIEGQEITYLGNLGHRFGERDLFGFEEDNKLTVLVGNIKDITGNRATLSTFVQSISPNFYGTENLSDEILKQCKEILSGVKE